MKDNLIIGREGREKLASGIRKAADAVGITMGTSGKNSLIQCVENPYHYITNDGATILSSIKFADPIEEIGREILLEAVTRSNKASGDGSSTCCILCSSIIEEGMKHIDEVSSMELKNSLEECLPIIEASINAQKRDITVDEVGAVASVSAEDAGIGAMIQTIYQQIGKTGIIQWDISKTFEDSYTIGKGITINWAGFASPYMADFDDKTGNLTKEAKWNNPYILLTRQKITTAADFNVLFEQLFKKDIKEIVVFCDEFEGNIIGDLIQTRAVRGFKTLLIKMPTIWKDEWYADLAKATGATIIDPTLGLSFKNMTMEHLGRVEHIVVSKDETFIDGIKDLSEHIASLEAEGTDESRLRASRLNTKTARYFVGAHSESALAYRRLKVEDAIAAAWQALNGGIVAGGGSALASIELPNTVGGKILTEALKAPAQQIATNAGYEYDIDWLDYKNGMGLDSRDKALVNMFDAQITDPANIVLNACRNAISVAASVLTASTIVTLIPLEKPNGL